MILFASLVYRADLRISGAARPRWDAQDLPDYWVEGR